MVYNVTTTKIFDIPPYFFFYVVGVVFASSLFIILLLKYNYDIPRYTKIFFLSAAGLLISARLFGFLTGLYTALANKEAITLNTFLNTGIVYYGGLIGFILSFLLICKIWNKKIDYGVVDITAVCIPLFLFFGRLGCFSAGCCYGIESNSVFSVLYTNRIGGEVVTAARFPSQLVESALSMVTFFVLMALLLKQKFRGHLVVVYLLIYATMRVILEFFRGDFARGVWSGVSFSQIVSIIILIYCVFSIIKNTTLQKFNNTVKELEKE